MKKKLLAFLTSITMLASIMPMAFADGEVTYYDAYTEMKTHETCANFDGSVKDSGERQGYEINSGNAYFNVNFGETAPIGIIIHSGFQSKIYGRMYIEVDDGTGNYVEIGYVDPFISGSFDAVYGWQKKRYLNLNSNASLCVGNKSLRLRSSGNYGKVYSIKFFSDASEVANIDAAYPNAYESLKKALSLNEDDNSFTAGMYSYHVSAGFGDVAPESLIFEISRTNTSEESVTFDAADLRLDNKALVASVPAVTAGANETVTQYARVLNPESFVGNKVVYLQFTNRLLTNASNGTGLGQDTVSKTLDFKFVNQAPASAYTELLTEAVAGSTKTIKLVDFGELGARTVTVAYTGTGDLTINGATTSLTEGAQSTITLDMNSFKGLKDLTITASEGLTVTSVIFNEMTFENPFDKDEVDAVYIGEDVSANDWTLAIEEKLAENSTAYYGTTFTSTDVTVPATDAGKLDLLKNIPTGDIIFIQAGDIAEKLVDAYSKLETAPYVIIVGNAAYAQTYGIAAITAEGDGLGSTGTYLKPVALPVVAAKNPYTTISLNQNTYDSKTMPDGSQGGYYIAGFTSWGSHGLGYEYKNYNFSKGISKVILQKNRVDSNPGATVEIRIDSYTGPVIAKFVATNNPDDPYESGWYNVEAQASIPVTGIHNIYIVNAKPAETLSKGSTFGNVQYIQFVEATELNEFSAAVAVTATKVDENIYLDSNTTATFENIADISKLASLPATIAATGTGVVNVKSGETLIATIDLAGADGSFKKVLGEIAETAVAASDITLSYEGDGHCYVKNINLATLDALSATLDASNYSDKHQDVQINANGQITGITCSEDYPDKYIMWSNVDFGDTQKMLELIAKIGFPRTATGEAINVYIDSMEENNIIGQLISSSSEKQEYAGGKHDKNAPLTSSPTGIHDVYFKVVTVKGSNRHEDGRYINPWSFSFNELTDSGEAINVYNKEIKVTDIVNSVETIYLQGMQTIITFNNGETIPANYMISVAVYDDAGRLLDVDTTVKQTVEGLNGASLSLSFEAFDAGNYTYKYFIWNADTLAPIGNGSGTVEVELLQ